MTKLRHVVTIRATRKIKPKSFVHKLYLKCLHLHLEHPRELTEEEIHIYNKDFIKHLGVHLTKDRSRYIEKWTI